MTISTLFSHCKPGHVIWFHECEILAGHKTILQKGCSRDAPRIEPQLCFERPDSRCHDCFLKSLAAESSLSR